MPNTEELHTMSKSDKTITAKKTIHIEAPGALVRISPNHTTAGGHRVTLVEVLAHGDHETDREHWINARPGHHVELVRVIEIRKQVSAIVDGEALAFVLFPALKRYVAIAANGAIYTASATVSGAIKRTGKRSSDVVAKKVAHPSRAFVDTVNEFYGTTYRYEDFPRSH